MGRCWLSKPHTTIPLLFVAGARPHTTIRIDRCWCVRPRTSIGIVGHRSLLARRPHTTIRVVGTSPCVTRVVTHVTQEWLGVVAHATHGQTFWGSRHIAGGSTLSPSRHMKAVIGSRDIARDSSCCHLCDTSLIIGFSSPPLPSRIRFGWRRHMVGSSGSRHFVAESMLSLMRHMYYVLSGFGTSPVEHVLSLSWHMVVFSCCLRNTW